MNLRLIKRTSAGALLFAGCCELVACTASPPILQLQNSDAGAGGAAAGVGGMLAGGTSSMSNGASAGAGGTARAMGEAGAGAGAGGGVGATGSGGAAGAGMDTGGASGSPSAGASGAGASGAGAAAGVSGTGGSGAASGAGGTSSAGSAGSGGASGSAGAAGSSGDSPLGWATWPMPNDPTSGLPNPQSYLVNADGTVLDNVTQLLWERDPPTTSMTYQAAAQHCAALSLGPFDDWRLPTLVELLALVDFSRSNPAIDNVAFPNVVRGEFWSAATLTGDTTAYTIPFGSGGIGSGDSANPGYLFQVRCVRAPLPTALPRHYTLGSGTTAGTVKDNWTGLTWEQAGPGLWVLRNFSRSTGTLGAKEYCQRLSLAGGGWRIPSVKELETLVERTALQNAAIDSTFFPGTSVNVAYWSASTAVLLLSTNWLVSFGVGSLDTARSDTDMQYIRCVK